MVIDARLKQESGQVLGEILSRAAQQDLFAETGLLKYLVPCGDAVFKHAQADDLGPDIEDVKRLKAVPRLVEILSRIEPLVEALSRGTHSYLWFVGD